MKGIVKIMMVTLLSMAFGTETNSCSILHGPVKQTKPVVTVSENTAKTEINTWNLATKFDF